MRKTLAIAAAAVLPLAFAACGDDDEEEPSDTGTEDTGTGDTGGTDTTVPMVETTVPTT